jgi:acyl transferase domain-containing protein
MSFSNPETDVAVIGLSGRFPGAASISAFWENIRCGVESIKFFSKDELRNSVPETLLSNPNYVGAKGYLEGWDQFDGGFFGYSASEAALMDPQIRILHECLWEALEDAGYSPDAGLGEVGIYIGGSSNPQWFCAAQSRATPAERYHSAVLNDNHAFSTRLSYKLGLHGPALTLQTACSSSLVALHVARQALLAGDCNLAVAGGVSISFPVKAGYLYERGMVSSPDGHCRAFDAEGQGTLGADGCGLAVLKPLQAAIEDGNSIYAIVRSTAVNNDGHDKIGYTAPSVSGQVEVITRAHNMAGVPPESIGYVEAHGTATPLGDPIEFEALNRAFRTDRRQFCAIGSVKTNVGHLNHAAGIAGFIKTVLALRDAVLPPSLHYRESNSQIDFPHSPFYVITTLKPWEGSQPRRACVSSFGIGGTNAHAVLEEAPQQMPRLDAQCGSQLLVLSAKTAGALEGATERLTAHLQAHADIDLGDIAYTLRAGRSSMAMRRAVLCSRHGDAIHALVSRTADCVWSSRSSTPVTIAYLLPGQGSQHPGMGGCLYAGHKDFRAAVDACLSLLPTDLSRKLRAVLGIHPASTDEREHIHDTWLAQPAVFICEYACSALLTKLGLRPGALLGHSLGELTAACLAGVFRLEDALRLVVRRAELMQSMVPGAMLSIAAPVADVQALLPPDAALAAVNGPERIVVSGSEDSIRELGARLTQQGVVARRLSTSHAFHSSMMDRAVPEFEQAVAAVERRPPEIPFLSNVTGRWIEASEARDPRYWARQLRETVRFSDCLETLLRKRNLTLVEIGPDQVLNSLARNHPQRRSDHTIVSCMRRANDSSDGTTCLLRTIGQLWTQGVDVNWGVLHRGGNRRVQLPTYSFESRRLPDITIAVASEEKSVSTAPVTSTADALFYVPIWRRLPPTKNDPTTERLLLFTPSTAASALAARCRAVQSNVVTVVPSDTFEQFGPAAFGICPSKREDYSRLLGTLDAQGALPTCIVHAWSLDGTASVDCDVLELHALQKLGLCSVLWLAQAIEACRATNDIRLRVVTVDAVNAPGTGVVRPAQSPIASLCPVITQECTGIRCVHGDVSSIDLSRHGMAAILAAVVDELVHGDAAPSVAWRSGERWSSDVAPLALSQAGVPAVGRGGVYLITGGFGRIGVSLAEQLFRTANARLVLVGRRLPDRNSATHARLERLEREGADFLKIAGDCGNLEQMRGLIAHTLSRWGKIAGVIHAAAVPVVTAITKLTPAAIEEQFHAKALGLLALRDALRGEEVDFVLVMSSLSSTMGGLGHGAYAAANRFQDACVESWSRSSQTRWISVNWDGWQSHRGETRSAFGVNQLALTTEQGLDACFRILATAGLPRVLVSATDLATRQQEWVGKLAARASNDRAAAGARHGNLEARLCAIWQEFFKATGVRPDDSFFALGGDSLTAVALVSRINASLGTHLQASDLLDAPTVVALVERVQQTKRTLHLPPLVSVSQEESCPLSFAQQAILSPRNLAYDTRFNCAGALELDATVDSRRMEQAFIELIRRHEVFRTSFDVSHASQRIAAAVDFRLPLFRCDRAESLARCRNFIRPFDLKTAPLLRAELQHLPEDRSLVLFDVHHALADGVSFAVMLSELLTLYNGGTLPFPELHYKDYAIWQERLHKAGAFTDYEQFWQRELEDFCWTQLPPAPHCGSPRFGQVIQQVEPGDYQQILEICERKQITVMTLLLAALSSTVRVCTRQSDITLGLRLSRRSEIPLQRMLGLFVEDVAYRVRLDDTCDHVATVAKTKDALKGILENPYSYELLNASFQRQRPTPNSDLFTILVNNLPSIEVPADVRSARLVSLPRILATKYYINLRVRNEETLTLDAKYRADKYSEGFMGDFLKAVISSANEIAASLNPILAHV